MADVSGKHAMVSRFTAPAAGSYLVDIRFDSQSHGSIYLNGAKLADDTLTDALSLQAGDQLDIVVDQYSNAVFHADIAPASAASGLAAPALPAASADDRTTRYVYDQLNRKVSETLVDVEYSNAADGSSQTGNATTSYGYDAVGNQTSVTDALGHTTLISYDAMGRISAVKAPAQPIDGYTNATPWTSFERDAHGNVLAMVQHGLSQADRTTLTRYDSHGHAVQTTRLANAASVDQFFSYNEHGNLVKQWQGATGNDGQTQTLFSYYQFDKLGRQTAIITPASTGQHQPARRRQHRQRQPGSGQRGPDRPQLQRFW